MPSLIIIQASSEYISQMNPLLLSRTSPRLICIPYIYSTIQFIIMRKTQQQEPPSHHELILNYKQDDTIQLQILLPIWTKTWLKFEQDILSYIIPAIGLPNDAMLQSNAVTSQMPVSTKPKHTFSFAYTTRELKKIIAMHSHMDVFVEVRKQITRIFYRIANAYVSYCFEDETEDISAVFVSVYRKIEGKLGVLIGCLNLVLNKFITRRGIEEQIYSIINKQLVNHHRYETYVNSCISSIESVRNYCLSIKQVFPDPNDPQYPSSNHPNIENVRILNKLKIFPYVDYVQRSKKYYCDLLPHIPKSIWMFPVVFNMIKCEKLLENTITPDDEQIQCVKKLLKSEGWRALQQETMIKIFCKEILDEIYDDMIQYVDYLLDFETESGQKEDGTKTNYILNLNEKKDVLKYLWRMTKILEKNYVNEKQKYMGTIKFSNVNSMEKKTLQNLNPSAKLLSRITMIIADIKKFIIPTENSKSKPNSLYKIIYFRDHIFSIISQCFDNDSKLLNTITIKIEQTIVHEEEAYNSKLCQIILSSKYKFPGIVNQTSKMLTTYNQIEMVDESDEITDINNKCSFQLFKLTPSKEQFIRRFEQEFSNYVITSWDSQLDLTEQENFIRPIQRESGYSLSRNIERMISDVWRNGEIVFYKQDKMVCRILCQDWPHPTEPKYKLADGLIEIRNEFEVFFLSETENDKKRLRWMEEFGRIFMNISGVESSFSQLQASIIVLLSKSYRPIKSSQFKQVLEYVDDDMEAILGELSAQHILIFNRDSKSYELNYDNTVPYSFESKQKESKKSQKKVAEKDYVAVIEAYIARILKRRKSVQKTDIAKILNQELKVGSHQPTMEEINTALERLALKQVISIEKTRGIIKYLQ